ncbi:ATP-grasp domain-containing protein [Alkalihalobacillus sp. LMS39]|uniref:ATP-grasp domain-containing protein n=1 Tax=Alkalihalobacillus sp. LMS39 TaxID=2924032 RepID=UPI001FB3BCFB|nr:ATP-grasp domain-containing protein [Alkalihalobacillus sp. LMS39]UOE93867.1 ATP-grasp domain-containing protein [Alkalihalobacillus sp. LMS39]
MANIMILGASALQIPLITQAIESGYKVVLVSPKKSDPGFNYATFPVYCDVRDIDLILEYALKYQIVGVLTDQTDIPVRTAAYIAEKLGLPGIGYETACLFTDKFLMREKCKELGLKSIQYQLVNNLSEAITFFDSIDGEVIIKPLNNQGSRGVAKISSIEELTYKFSYTQSFSDSVIIEEYINGREFVVEGIAYDYKFENLIVGDTYYFDIPDAFSATKREFPSTAQENTIDNIKSVNSKIITGFGLKQGITHSEFIVDEKGEVFLIETAARGGGAFISSDLIPISTNVNTEEFLINIATGIQEEFPKVSYSNKVCCYIAFFLPIGEVVSIDGVDEVRQLDFIHRNSLDTVYPGLKVEKIQDKSSRVYTTISADSYQQLQERIQFLKNTLEIKVLTQEGIKGPIWD